MNPMENTMLSLYIKTTASRGQTTRTHSNLIPSAQFRVKVPFIFTFLMSRGQEMTRTGEIAGKFGRETHLKYVIHTRANKAQQNITTETTT